MSLIQKSIALCLTVAAAGCGPQSALGRDELPKQLDAVFPIRDGRLWGAIDGEGVVLVKPKYEGASYGFLHPSTSGAGRLVGQQGVLLTSAAEWCYVSARGRSKIKPIAENANRVFNFGECLFGVETRSKKAVTGTVPRWALWAAVRPDVVYDPLGEWNPSVRAIPVNQFSEGLLTVVVNGRFGYADRKGVLVIPPQYEAAGLFNEGLAPVMIDGKWGYVDREGKLAISAQFETARPFDEGMALVSSLDRLFFINDRGEDAQAWPYSSSVYFVEGLASRFDSDKGMYGYCDKTGSWRVAPQFEAAWAFNEGLAGVEAVDPNRSGFIDTTGTLKVSIPHARIVTSFRYGMAWVETNRTGRHSLQGYINRDGDWAWNTGNQRSMSLKPKPK